LRHRQELDNKIVQDTLDRERKVLEKEQAARELRKNDTQNYRRNLKAQIGREKEDDAILDHYRQQQLGTICFQLETN
jgi:hypothetical protein